MKTNIPNRDGIAGVAVKEHVMSIAKRLVITAAGILLVASIVCAQEQNAPTGTRSTTTVTAAATADRLRFTAPSTVVQMRLEVHAANGEKLFDNEIRGGNVIDWHLQDGQAQRLFGRLVLAKLLLQATRTLSALTKYDQERGIITAGLSQQKPPGGIEDEPSACPSSRSNICSL